ncbi:MAG: hypothetical protein ACYSVY_21725, partial [Planctomycetota bacterium]
MREDTVQPGTPSPAHTVGYRPDDPDLWGASVPTEVGAAIDALVAEIPIGTAVTAAAPSGAANTVQVSAGADRTIRDAATLNIFGRAALSTDITNQFINALGGTG